MAKLQETVRRLCEVSVAKHRLPAEPSTWPAELDRKRWSFAPELISLYGTPTWDELDVEGRKRLAFYEAVNFFSLNIHGERFLVEGLTRRLYRGGNEVISPYLHHFLGEENNHMTYFGGFCQRYAGRIYPEKKLAMTRDHEPGEEDFLFFARALIFEEIVDVYNRRMARDERLVPLVRDINHMHHVEETRHLAFGRELTRSLFERFSPEWSGEVLERVREELTGFLRATWLEYYNADVYRDAGLTDPFALRRRAFDRPLAKEHRADVSAGCVGFFVESGILEEMETP